MQWVKGDTPLDIPNGFLRSSYPAVYYIQQLGYHGLSLSIGYALAVWMYASHIQSSLAFCLAMSFFFLSGACWALAVFLVNRRRRSINIDPLFIHPVGALWEGLFSYRISQIWSAMFFLMCCMFMGMFASSLITETRKLVSNITAAQDAHFRYYTPSHLQPAHSAP